MPLRPFKLLRTLAAIATLAAGAAYGAITLPAHNVDATNITVSGMSSGGIMAVQLGYAYSGTFKGVGVFAGVPYNCGGHNYNTSCIFNSSISSSQISQMQADIDSWSGNQIDPKSNVANQKVYTFVGTLDNLVGP